MPVTTPSIFPGTAERGVVSKEHFFKRMMRITSEGLERTLTLFDGREGDLARQVHLAVVDILSKTLERSEKRVRLQAFINNNQFNVGVLPTQSLEILLKMRHIITDKVGPTLQCLRVLHGLKANWGGLLEEYRHSLSTSRADPTNQAAIQNTVAYKEQIVKTFKEYKTTFANFNTIFFQ